MIIRVIVKIALVLIITGILYAWGPDIVDYFIDRYDEWQHVLTRIRRRRNKR